MNFLTGGEANLKTNEFKGTFASGATSTKFRSWDGRMALKSRPIDATYPDYERVLPAKDKPLAPAEEVRFNLAYLSGLKEVARIFSHPKTLSAKCRFYGNSAPVAFDMENPDQDKATVIIMPMRI